MGKGTTTTALVSTGGASNSLRTTIPMWIVQQFGLSAGSKIEWALEVKNGEMSISVIPQE
tara:strand:- start:54 stop:233 length:180 start_codon:yes stop_codon:yes gene_type:complete